MIWYLNSKLDFNLSCAKDFRNLNSMVTWCINFRLFALIIFSAKFPIIKRLSITLMYCNRRLHAWLSIQSRLAILLSSLIASLWVGLQTLLRFYWWDGPGLIGFFLLQYSVLFTVESLCLLYLLFISWFICSRRWCIDKLGVFHANQITMSSSTSEFRVRLAPWNRFKPSSEIFLLTVPRRYFFGGSFMFFCLVFVMPLCVSVYSCLVVTCWERADHLALICGVLLWDCHFPIGILGQVWYLIVSLPDLCTLTYFPEVPEYAEMRHNLMTPL